MLFFGVTIGPEYQSTHVDQLAKLYKIDDYSGPSGSLWQCYLVKLSH